MTLTNHVPSARDSANTRVKLLIVNNHTSNADNLTINKLHVVNINFQSIMNKKADFQEFIFTYKPHIIVGAEIWLSTSICNNEVIPGEWNYTFYRQDRPDGYGSVMVTIY